MMTPSIHRLLLLSCSLKAIRSLRETKHDYIGELTKNDVFRSIDSGKVYPLQMVLHVSVYDDPAVASP